MSRMVTFENQFFNSVSWQYITTDRASFGSNPAPANWLEQIRPVETYQIAHCLQIIPPVAPMSAPGGRFIHTWGSLDWKGLLSLLPRKKGSNWGLHKPAPKTHFHFQKICLLTQFKGFCFLRCTLHKSLESAKRKNGVKMVGARK